MKKETIRSVVLAELNRRGWTKYRLWKEVEEKVSKPTIYDYLAGGNISSDSLERVLQVLDISLVANPKK